MVPAAAVMRSPVARMVSSGRARGSLPAQLATYGHEYAVVSMPRRVATAKAMESASTFRTPRHPAVLAPGGCARPSCARTWPSSWISACAASDPSRSGRIRTRRVLQMVRLSAGPHGARSTANPSRLASQVSASQSPGGAVPCGNGRAGSTGGPSVWVMSHI